MRPCPPLHARVLEHFRSCRGARHRPQNCGASLTGPYLPREIFFGRLVFAGDFLPVCASDFGRFFPATSGSFRLISPETLATAATHLEDLPFPRNGRELIFDVRPTRLNLLLARVTGFALPVLVEEFLSHFRQNATAKS